MSKVVTEQQINTFVRGLITEASPLTFPENAALDLSNVVFNRDGTISRRLGIDFESGYTQVSTGLSSTSTKNARISTHSWEFPSGSTTVSIQVVRINNQLWFFDTLAGALSSNILNLGVPVVLNAVNVTSIDAAVINGQMVIVSSDLDKPILLTYDPTLQTVSQEDINIEIRDIFGVESEVDLYTRPTTLSYEHAYNLVNQGWSERIVPASQTKVIFWNPGSVFGSGYVPIIDDDANILLNVHPFNYIDVGGTYFINADTIEAIEATYVELGSYPSNSDLWQLGKIGDATSPDFEQYHPTALDRNSVDFAQVARGRFIIDAFNRGTSRQAAGPQHPTLNKFRQLDHNSTLVDDTENGRLSTVTAYSGRVFYSGVVSRVTDGDRNSPNYSGFVFFSQLIQSKRDFGKCYQEADPTSSDINELVATDGGTIQIPEANRIYKIFPARQSLIVFSDNGIWEIYGDSGFSATGYQLNKVSSSGTRSPNTIIDAAGTIIYWSKSGIQSLVQDTVSGRYITQPLSLNTIQSFYNNLSDVTRANAVGFYDEKENQVRWLFNDLDDYSETSFTNRYNKELILDLTLQSFYINEIAISEGGFPFVVGYVKTSGKIYASGTDPVVTFDDPVQVLTNPVVVNKITTLNSAGQYKFLTISDIAGASKITFSAYSNADFLDWVSYDLVGVDYSSYLVTGYQLYNDWMRPKQAPYLFMYFDRTEDGFENVGGSLVNTNQSSCLVQSQWNWADSITSGKWGTPFQSYRLLRNYIPSGVSDPFDYGYGVIVTKNKLRGRGKAISLKFYSETGKNFRIHGWSLVVTGNSTP